MNHNKKLFLICGGTSRAGLDIAIKLAESGQSCIVAGRHPPRLGDLLFQHSNIHYENVDFAFRDSVDSFCLQIKKYEITSCMFFQRSRSDDILESVQVSIASSVTVLNAIETSLAANQGSVIFIGSILSTQADPSQTLSYHISKGGLPSLVKYLALKYGPQGIRVNLLSLSTFEHSQNSKGYAPGTVLDKVTKNLIPSRQAVQVEDVLKTALFLHQLPGAAITGQEIHIDGGFNVLSQMACALKFISTSST